MRKFFTTSMSMHLVPILFAVGFLLVVQRDAEQDQIPAKTNTTQLKEIQSPASISFWSMANPGNIDYLVTAYNAGRLVVTLVR